MILKLGSTGPAVATLVNDLRRLGFALPQGSVFNSDVKRSIEAFQVGHVDSSGTPLVVDGKVGPHTEWAIRAALTGLTPTLTEFGLPPLPATGGSAAGRGALAIAAQDMAAGRGEIGSNNSGPDVASYLAPTGLGTPNNWCAAFVSHCFQQALGHNGVFGYLAGAQAVYNRMNQLGHAYTASLSNPPQPGDIIVWRRVDPSNPAATGWYGHIGLVHSFADGNLWTIEGNRGSFPSKVKSFRYSWPLLVSSASNDKFKGLYGMSRHP
jgi:peptidoglycan hydrolase-like protein with peptidoglycan-binding domain